jgi:hypothetical protein
VRATVVVALGLLTACSSSSPSTAPTTVVTTVPTTASTTVVSTAPTTAFTTTSSTAPPTTVPVTTASPRAPTTDGAAGALLAAWKSADRAAAALVADAAAIDALFAQPYLPSVQDRGCTDGTQTTNSCIWRYQGQTVVQLTVDGSLATGFRIVKVEYLS